MPSDNWGLRFVDFPVTTWKHASPEAKLGGIRLWKTPMELVNKVILDSMVRLVRTVAWGPGRDKLLSMSQQYSSEGSLEHGWDNYSTAARLWWTARVYKLAAEARFPHEGDMSVAAMRDSLIDRLVQDISLVEDDDDVGEVTRHNRAALSMALSPSLKDGIVEELIDELSSAGLIDCPEHVKSLHVTPVSDVIPTVSVTNLRWF
jgi:hypothetical protein